MSRSQKNSDQTVKIANLKAKLAHYLRLVKAGEEITVIDRNLPIAKIIPLQSSSSLETIPAEGSFSELKSMKIPPAEKKPKIDTLALLLEERGSR